MIPDFLLVKAQATLTDDTLIGLIEIKRNSLEAVNAKVQLNGYMKRAMSKTNRIDNLQGYLVCGGTTEVYRWVDERLVLQGDPMFTIGMDVMNGMNDGNDFIASIRQLARDTWNMQ